MKGKSILFKIVTSIILVLLLSVLTSIIITSTNQKKDLLSTAKQTLAINTKMLNQVIRNIMLSGEAEIATKTMESLKTIEEFEEIAIYRTNGEKAFYNYDTIDFVNNYQKEKMFDYTTRSEEIKMNNETFQEVIKTNTPIIRELKETGEMEYYFPILNYAECRQCHGDKNFIRGVSHFKISIKSIYNKVNMARLLLTTFFTVSGIIIFTLLFILLRKLVINKILLIGKSVSVVATGNLDIQIDMETSDELGILSGQLNNMIVSLKDKKQLEIENALIESSLKENQKYLKNIQEGLLLVDRDLIINENYSHYLINMFGKREIAGLKLPEFLFSYNESNKEIRDDLEKFINMLFENDTADIEMFNDINPLLNCWINVENRVEGNNRILIDAFVQRIFDDGDNIENVMIIFKDKTNVFYAEKELEEERRRSQSELDHITSLLHVGPQTFLEFINEAASVLNSFKNNLTKIDNREFIDHSFREIHSLKGTAAYFNFKNIEKLSHNLENILSSILQEGILEDSMENMTVILNEIFNEFDSIKILTDRFKEFANLKLEAENQEKKELNLFFKSLELMVYRIADDMDKKIKVDFSSKVDTLPHLAGLKNSIIHLLRNSIDHGIEEPLERISLEKDETANISIKIDNGTKNRLDIVVKDDGRGIDYEKLELSARKKGFLEPEEVTDHQKLLNILFMPGFSSKEDVTQISGRGVGLNVVRDDIKKLGGKIGISSQLGKGSTFTIHLPYKEE